jgi:hypothetical protein
LQTEWARGKSLGQTRTGLHAARSKSESA